MTCAAGRRRRGSHHADHSAARTAFAAEALARAPEVVALTRRLMAVPSPNPPGDVRACAEEAAALLREVAPEADGHAARDLA